MLAVTCMQASGDGHKEIMSQIGKVAAEVPSLNKIWSSKVYNLKTRLQMFNSNIISVLMHGCNSWKSPKGTGKSLNALEKY